MGTKPTNMKTFGKRVMLNHFHMRNLMSWTHEINQVQAVVQNKNISVNGYRLKKKKTKKQQKEHWKQTWRWDYGDFFCTGPSGLIAISQQNCITTKLYRRKSYAVQMAGLLKSGKSEMEIAKQKMSLHQLVHQNKSGEAKWTWMQETLVVQRKPPETQAELGLIRKRSH